MDEIARGERVVLRSIVDDDARALLAVLGDPEVMRFRTGDLATLADCARFVAANREEHDRTGLGAWAICTTDDPTLIGYCRLRRDVDWTEPGEIEIGYRLATRAWGRGYATEAAGLAGTLAFDRFGAETLIAVIDPANTASVAVAERLGLHPARELMLPEYDHPDIVHAITAAAWRTISR